MPCAAACAADAPWGACCSRAPGSGLASSKSSTFTSMSSSPGPVGKDADEEEGGAGNEQKRMHGYPQPNARTGHGTQAREKDQHKGRHSHKQWREAAAVCVCGGGGEEHCPRDGNAPCTCPNPASSCSDSIICLAPALTSDPVMMPATLAVDCTCNSQQSRARPWTTHALTTQEAQSSNTHTHT